MLWLLKKAIERLKTLLITDAALDLEAQFLARQVERKADLLQKAQEHEEQGLSDLAEELRGQAADLTLERPLATALLPLHGFADESWEPEHPRLESPATDHLELTTSNRKTKRTGKPKTARKPAKSR